MGNSSPIISVIMPVYNEEAYVAEAIESILTQSFSEFELIIVNDASKDNSCSIIDYYHRMDKRIKVIENEENIGITRSLNIGLQHASGEFFARMDSDDIAKFGRLTHQIGAFNSDPDLAIVGSSFEIIDFNGIKIGAFERSYNHIVCKFISLFHTPFIHSTVMVKRSAATKFELRYNENFYFAQDYELWSRMLESVKGLHIPACCLKYRSHAESISNLFAQEQRRSIAEISIRTIFSQHRFLRRNEDTIKSLVLAIHKLENCFGKFEYSYSAAMEEIIMEFSAANVVSFDDKIKIRKIADQLLESAQLFVSSQSGG